MKKGRIIVEFNWSNMSMSKAVRLLKPLEKEGLKIIGCSAHGKSKK